MGQRLTFPVIAALALAAPLSGMTQPATGDTPQPGTVITVAGTGTPGDAGDNGPATKAELRPGVLAVDGTGNLYISDWYNNRVRRVDSVTGIITTVAGTGEIGFSGDGGPATAAQLNRPAFVIPDGEGNLFISDFFNYRVRRVDAATGIITTVAGSGPVNSTTDPTDIPHGSFSGDNGPAAAARLNGPLGLAIDSHGNLFIEDAYNQRLRKVSPDGVITTVAGNGLDRSSGDGGPATQASLAVAWGLTIDTAGNLFVAETGGAYDGPKGVISNRVRKVDAATGIITTVAGIGGAGGFAGDGGKATEARLNLPEELAVDSAGNLFIADQGNYRVRKVGLDGIITTVAGNGTHLYAGDGSMAPETGLRGPGGMAIDAAGNLLISVGAPFWESGGQPDDPRVLKVFGAAAPGLLSGMTLPR